MRKDPPVDQAYLHATHVFDLAPPEVLVVNDLKVSATPMRSSMRNIFRSFVPKPSSPRHGGHSKLAFGREDPLVVKPVDGHAGAGSLF